MEIQQRANPSTENWDEFKGDWFKASFFKEQYAIVPVTAINSNWGPNNKALIVLTIEFEGKPFWFGLNVGNQAKILEACPNAPKEIVGNILKLGKVRVKNPRTGKIVDGLEVVGIVKPLTDKEVEDQADQQQIDREMEKRAGVEPTLPIRSREELLDKQAKEFEEFEATRTLKD